MQNRKQYLREIKEEIKNYPEQHLIRKVFNNREFVTRKASGRLYGHKDLGSAIGIPDTSSKSFRGPIRRYLILLFVILDDLYPTNTDSVVQKCVEDIDSFIENSQNLSKDTIRELKRRAEKCRQLVSI